MSKRSKYTAEEKYQILKAYEDGFRSINEVASLYRISPATYYNWRCNYNEYGIDGLKESKTWKSYSKELKEHAVNDYLSGKYSQAQVVSKYEISDRKVLLDWVNKYNCHREIKATAKGLGQSNRQKTKLNTNSQPCKSAVPPFILNLVSQLDPCSFGLVAD